jgi:Ca2+-binding EF-hand superfamily protein
VARYLRISKDNMRALRGALLDLADPSTLTIGRHLFQIAVSRAGFRALDGKVLNHLFTMFDEGGHDRICVQDFVGGIAPLSCPSESLTQTLRHCLQAVDFEDSGRVTARQLVRLLKSKSNTRQQLSMYFARRCTLSRKSFVSP